MSASQPAVLSPVPTLGRFVVFALRGDVDVRAALAHVRDGVSIERTAIGIGQPLALALRAKIPGLRPFPAIAGPGVAFPSTQGALWAFFAGSEQGAIFDRARALAARLGEGFALTEDVATFQYDGGRDLSGYEDGTENPVEEKAVTAAILSGAGKGLDGSSFVAVQKYVHDLGVLAKKTQAERDLVIGRRHADNTEIADAPASAHVKRAAQESFEPTAFMVRRSMPWGDVAEHGLYFVAYGASLDAFERVLTRMAGLEDGVTDSLLSFARATTGGYYWCPPVRGKKLDLSALGM